jgi:peptide/nickel transport system substrate-binding protein
MHKKLWFIALIAVFTMIVAQCGGTPAAPPASEGGATAPAAEQPAATQAPAEQPAATQAPAVEQPATSGEIDRTKTVVFDIDGGKVTAPDLWNTFIPSTSRRDQGFHQAIVEPLFILNYESGEIEPWLGESFTANETLDEWTLKLREGITWSDGEAMTADDVVFTINMLIEKAPDLNDSASMKKWVKSVEKVDDLTTKFTLTAPNPRFQLDYFSVKIWGGVNIVPEHIWKDQDPLTFKNYDPEKGWPVYTGPYKLESFNDAGTEFVYVRDPNWWGAKTGFKPLPQPERLVWTWAGPEETRTKLMADGQLDSLMDVTLGAFEALKAQNPNVIAWKQELPYTWLDPCSRTLEVNHAVEPWGNKNMRWALNYAIDRDQIVAVAYEGTTVASRHFFPAYPPLNRYVDLLDGKGLYETYPITLHDPDKAKQLIEAEGYVLGGDGYYAKDGKQLTLDIQTHEAFIEKQRIAQVIVEQLQAIGINATTRNIAAATWGENFQNGNYEAKMGWQTCGSINEPWASMDTFNISWYKPVGERADANGWRWQNEEYSRLVDQIGVLPLNDPQIDDLFVQAMTIWMDELPVIPITQAKKLIPFDTTYWTGWPDSENNYLHSTTWWQSTHKIIHELKPAQ